MKKTFLTIGITILSCLLSFTNLQAELRWKNISKISKSKKLQYVLDVKAFGDKCYVLFTEDDKYRYVVSENKGDSWNNLHKNKEITLSGEGIAGQIINEKNVIYYNIGINENYFMKSVNGGKNWDKVPVNGTIDNQPIENKKVQLFYMTMCDPKIGSAFGRYGKKLALYTTDDGWKNMEGRIVEWANKIEGISEQVMCEYYLSVSKDTIIRSGYYNTAEDNLKIVLSYSYDRGKTYTKHDTLNEVFYTLKPMVQCSPIKRCTAGFWTLSGGKVTPPENVNGRVYKCKNLGDKWEEIFYNGDSKPIENCDFFDENRGIVIGVWNGDDHYRTYDGGKTWIRDTLVSSEGKIENAIYAANHVVYVGDTALIIGGSLYGNVYRLEDVKRKEYNVDTLEQIKIVAKENKFKLSTLKFVAFAEKENLDECWIDINNNKSREEFEKIKVQRPNFYPETNEIIITNKEVTLYGKFNELLFLESGIGEIQMNKCSSLESLYVENNPLIAVDMKGSPNIARLFLRECKTLTSIDLSENSKLAKFITIDTPLMEIYMPKDNNILELSIEKSKLKEIDLSSFKDTAVIFLEYNSRLKKVIFDENSTIKRFIMRECNDEVSTMNLSGLKNAEGITIELTGFSELDLSQCNKLKYFRVNNNPELKKIRLPQHDSLLSVDVSRNYISELDFKPSKNTQVFYCHDNADISKLDFTGNEGLAVVDCFRNQIKGDEADKLMESLPDRTGKEPEGRIRFTAYNSDGKYKVGNWAYAYSVEKAKAKNWSIQYYPQGDYKGTSSVSEGTMKVFNIYPNPADNILNIPEYETLITDIEIYNSSLDQVKTLSPAAKIDISDLPAGVYYIKLNYVMHKFVKK